MKLLKKYSGIYLLPMLASIFLLWYIFHSSADIVSSDYIRLVNQYLPDTLNPEKFFLADILTRIPISYPLRFLNQSLFHYSVHFDRVLGVVGLFLSSIVIMKYMEREHLQYGFYILIVLIFFSLNKWEMLLNGSGYAHFLSFFLFYENFYLLERFFQGTLGKKQRRALYILPLLSLLTAGPYIIVYAISLMLAYFYLLLSGNKNCPRKQSLYLLLEAMLVLFLYLISNHFAVYEYAGASEVTLREVLTEYRAFSMHFLLNGLASMLLSGELLEALLEQGILSMGGIYLIGLLLALAYLLAAFLYIREKLYKKSLFPAILLLYGIGSHLVVFLSRYIFLRETYAWQSRYALQYQSGIIGIFLIFALFSKKYFHAKKKKARYQKFTLSLILLYAIAFILGTCYTIRSEVQKMPYRLIRYEEMRETALALSEYSDEELVRIYEYRHGGDRIRAAFSILEENSLNVYS